MCTEIHIDTGKSYKGVGFERYLTDLQEDAKLLSKIIREERLGTVVFNTFNRKALEFVYEELKSAGLRVERHQGIVLTGVSPWCYRPRRHRKIQRRMFGQVLPHRRVDAPESWALLVVK